MAALASGNRAPVLIPVDAAEGMAARGPEYQKADIPAGFFRGSPPQPKEDVATISIAVRLEARQNLSEEVVTRLTKRLFAIRRSLQSEVPGAAAIEKPDTEKGSADAVHPGASAYYENNEKSFMDQYGDWLYISAMAFSGLGSVIAAMFGLTRARARKAALGLVDQLIEVKQVAIQRRNCPALADWRRKSKTYQQRACASRVITISTRLGWPRYGSPLTKRVGRSAIGATNSKQSHRSSPMLRRRDHQ
jgi:NMT1 family protein